MSRYDDLVQEHAERRQHDAETRASFDALPAAFRDAEVERLRAEGHEAMVAARSIVPQRSRSRALARW